MSRQFTLRWTASGAVLALFGLSCALPACYGEGGFLESGVEAYGCDLLVFGWLHAGGFAWLANLLLVPGVVCLGTGKDGAGALIAGVAVALSPGPLFRFDALGLGQFRLQRPFALVCWQGQLELRIGYFLWVLSHSLLFACFAGLLSRRFAPPRNCAL
jgi:hypothetical protein